jgi:hypothetical protein
LLQAADAAAEPQSGRRAPMLQRSVNLLLDLQGAAG